MAGQPCKVNLDRGDGCAKQPAMTETRVKPDDCQTMTEVRHGVDRLDEQIVALLGERFGYMRAAARIKPDRSAVRDEARKAEVIANARRCGKAASVPDAVVADLYERLVEASIAYEFDRYDEIRG